MQLTLIDTLGYFAAVGTTGSFVPQVIKVYKTKKTDDLSLGMFAFFCLGTSLWMIYGFLVKSYPVVAANLVTLSLSAYILIIKIRNELSKRVSHNKS